MHFKFPNRSVQLQDIIREDKIHALWLARIVALELLYGKNMPGKCGTVIQCVIEFKSTLSI